MKATELMIGDWVMVKVLSQIPNTYVLHTWTANDYYRDFKVMPIPLTPEILEKNGFGSETFLTAEWGRKVYFKEFPGCVVEPADSGKYIFGTTKYWSKTYSDGSPIDWGTMYESRIYNLQYIHELQHALRLCGLNELADNFKV